MDNKMLHRGSMTRLTSTETTLPVLSTCILLLIQFQTFHALPTSSSISNNNSGSRQQEIGANIRASLHPTAYGSAYPYSSYRPGARLEDSYRPYNAYYPKEFADSSSSSSGLYAPETPHPNSVYSRQSSSASSLSENLDKVIKLIEKEIAVSDRQQQQQQIDNKQNPLPININGGTTEEKRFSLPLANNNTPTRNNKPRLSPLPSVQSSYSSTATAYETENDRKQQHQQNINDKEQELPQSAATSTTAGGNNNPALRAERNPEFSPVPPPFAPELDPQYERRQYGLGALTLLDQAGPFW